MEVSWNVGGVGILESGDEPSILSVLIGPVVSEVWRRSRRRLSSPSSAPVTAPIAMVKDVIASSSHVVNHGISIDSHTGSSASLNHVSQLFATASPTGELVGSWLIVEPPRIELAILGPLKAEGRL